MQRQIAEIMTLLAERAVPCSVVAAPVGPRLAEALWLVQFGDLVSVFLAYRRGIDPTPVPSIDRLKAALRPSAERGSSAGETAAKGS